MRSSLRWIALGTAGLVAALALSYGMGWLRPAAPRAVVPMRQSVYVWQRDWSDAVQRAVLERAPSFDAGLVALGAEIAWKDGVPQHVLVPIERALLAGAARPSGIALRWEPSELQLDFDSATSRLDDYRRWVEIIAADASPVPVTITVLPAWMSSRAFGPLVASTAGFVLQVHSVEKAELESESPSLCDAASAVSWTEHAAHFGVPFRVALPTYGYLAVLDDDGTLRGLVAETGSPLLSAGARARLVSAEPQAMAALVAQWSRSRPALMEGPAAQLEVRAVPVDDATVELVVENRGDLDAPAPDALEVSWTGGASVVGADGLAGMQWRHHGAEAVRFERAAEEAALRVAPRGSRILGWIRLSTAAEVKVDVVEDR